MSKSLIITEKPSVAGDIAKALGGFKKGKDYYENEKFLISWAVGRTGGPKGSAPSWMFQGPKEKLYPEEFGL